MVPAEVMFSLRKVAIQGDQQLCLGVLTVSNEMCPKAVGEAYVHLVTFAAYDAVSEGCIFECFMEHMWCHSLALGQTLQCLSAHRIILE